MPFQKNHKLGAKQLYSEPLDSQAIAFKGRMGQKEKLKTIPNWQERLRNYVDQLIAETEARQNE